MSNQVHLVAYDQYGRVTHRVRVTRGEAALLARLDMLSRQVTYYMAREGLTKGARK